MNHLKKLLIMIPLVLLTIYNTSFEQGKPYDGPDDPAGDIAAEREGYMNGNRVYLYFQNTTELADWPRVDVSKWPNNYRGVKMTDGINILLCSEVFLENDTIPVTDPKQIESRTDLDTLYFCQTSFRGGMDMNPEGTVEWGLYPVFGYFNELSEYPAMSNRPESWPPDGWPSRGDQKKWPGVWNGRFGLGVMYADLETFFVANDAHDQEYLEATDTVRYYPRPGIKIGDKKPDVTIQKGLPWGGIGIRVETRGYQWENPLARDVIFWEYNVSNISDYDLPHCAFGYHVDNAIGNDSNDELGYFDTLLDIAYSWDIDGIGYGGLETGIMGFAFLESPGLGYDGIDNDEDGLLDELRDNDAGTLIGPKDGITDLDKFLAAYRLKESELRPHYEGDEDQDWMDGEDTNNDGIYQDTENPGDDVGLDGIGPNELNYPGADEGECNHQPDFKEGLGCEPNFAATDVTESDMTGLNSFSLFHVTQELDGKPRTFHQDWVMYQLVGTGIKEPWIGEISNLIEIFGAGPFPLYKGRTERISMAMLHSYENLADLNQTIPEAPVMFELKQVVQMIYEKDYRFAQPPKMPTLTATAGNGRVTLTWDNMAERATREPFLGGANDFEGYRLIRATDKKFQDAMVITDGNGDPLFYKPIFECDLINNIKGYTDYGLKDGMGYYLGNDTGIQHYFIDENVQNGRTYYYGLVAYDFGIPDSISPPGIAPSENNIVIDLDEWENIVNVGKNVAIVTPHQTAAGYIPNSLEIVANSIKKTSGYIVPEIVSKNSLKVNHTYTFKFAADTIGNIRDVKNNTSYLAIGYNVFDVTDSNRLVAYENADKFKGTSLVYDRIIEDESTPKKYRYLQIGSAFDSDIADGVLFRIKSDVITSARGGYDYANSGWSIGNSMINLTPTEDAMGYFPWDFELIFTNNANAYTGKTKYSTMMRDENKILVEQDSAIVQPSINFFMINKTFPGKDGEYDTLDVFVKDMNMNGKVDMLEDKFLFGAISARIRWSRTLFSVEFDEEPAAGDIYYCTFIRPFFVTDSLTFKVLPEGDTDENAIKNMMDDIKVVPNPYVATNTMEPVIGNWLLNQRRQIMFTHLPARCDIKIFTVSGVLVAEIPVDNPSDNGIIHWNLKTREDLEVAAGMYIYHVQARDVDAEKIGKFAVIK
ncbi:hypothetical protein JXQ31_05555 [candidate division KSB1 bacterium]|nr:hypothetical protein [candidate division KSB1 bacterium]